MKLFQLFHRTSIFCYQFCQLEFDGREMLDGTFVTSKLSHYSHKDLNFKLLLLQLIVNQHAHAFGFIIIENKLVLSHSQVYPNTIIMGPMTINVLT